VRPEADRRALTSAGAAAGVACEPPER